MLLVTAAFKSLLSIQTFIPYTFYLPKSVVSEHYGGLFCQLGRSCLEKPEITFSYKKAAADIQKTIMFVTFYSTIAWCPFVGDEIHKNLVPASFENLEQNFWDLARWWQLFSSDKIKCSFLIANCKKDEIKSAFPIFAKIWQNPTQKQPRITCNENIN